MEFDFHKVPATASAETVADFRAWFKATNNADYSTSDEGLAGQIPIRIADTLPATNRSYILAEPPSSAATTFADCLCDDFYKLTEAKYDDGKTFSPALYTVQYLAKRIEITKPGLVTGVDPTPVVATPADTAQLATPTPDEIAKAYERGVNEERSRIVGLLCGLLITIDEKPSQP